MDDKSTSLARKSASPAWLFHAFPFCSNALCMLNKLVYFPQTGIYQPSTVRIPKVHGILGTNHFSGDVCGNTAGSACPMCAFPSQFVSWPQSSEYLATYIHKNQIAVLSNYLIFKLANFQFAQFPSPICFIFVKICR